MQHFILAKRNEIVELCRTHHVRRFSVFGSAVRDDFDPATGDANVRVDFQPDFLEGYVRNFHSLHDSLVATFGRRVEIISSKEIRNPYLRKEVEGTKVTLYAA